MLILTTFITASAFQATPADLITAYEYDLTNVLLESTSTNENPCEMSEESLSRSEKICEEHSSLYGKIIQQSENIVFALEKRIQKQTDLVRDTRTFVPEKEEEVDQVKIWVRSGLSEIDAEKNRFYAKTADYDRNIKACEYVLQLINADQQKSFLQVSKSSAEMLKLAETDLDPQVKALVLMAARQEKEDSDEISQLLQEVKADFEAAREELSRMHEKSLAAAQSYAEEKNYTYVNLVRQTDLIMDNQIKAQQDLYHMQLERDEQEKRLNSTVRSLKLLSDFCSLLKNSGC
jgi:hypothetical protein